MASTQSWRAVGLIFCVLRMATNRSDKRVTSKLTCQGHRKSTQSSIHWRIKLPGTLTEDVYPPPGRSAFIVGGVRRFEARWAPTVDADVFRPRSSTPKANS